MAAGIEIEIRKVRGPWKDVIIQPAEQADVVRVVAAHFTPRPGVSAHTPKPKVLPGMWELASYTEYAASGVQLIAGHFKVFAKKFKGVDGTERRGRFELVIEKPGVGLFEIKGVTIVRDDNITLTKEFMKILYKEPIVLEMLFISGIVGEGSYGDITIPYPPIGEGEHVPVF